MLGYEPSLTPVETGYKPLKEWDNTPTDKTSYQRLMG